MNEAPLSNDDPLFLASRAMDEALCDAEQLRLEKARRESALFRSDEAKLWAVDRTVKAWASSEGFIENMDLAETVLEQIRKHSSVQKQVGLDRLLSRWADAPPELDSESFVAEVMHRVRVAQRRDRSSMVFLRLGAPLAAAAVLALVVTLGLFKPAPNPVGPPVKVAVISQVSIGPLRLAPESSEPSSAVVSFSRKTDLPPRKERGASSIAIAWAGVEPSITHSDEAPPL